MRHPPVHAPETSKQALTVWPKSDQKWGSAVGLGFSQPRAVSDNQTANQWLKNQQVTSKVELIDAGDRPATAPHSPPPFQGLSHELGQILQPSVPIQAKLAIGQPSDKYEQEADRVAAAVVNQLQKTSAPPPFNTVTQMSTPTLRLKSIGQEHAKPEATYPGIESAVQQAQGKGQPLDETIRCQMEQSFKADFRRVRVHISPEADALNRLLNADAFTVGQDVFFRQGNYEPHSQTGQELLAHELAHTVQQSQQPASSPNSLVIQAKFSDLKNNLVKSSPDRQSNTNYQAILTLLEKAIVLENSAVSLSRTSVLWSLAGQIKSKIPAATSRKRSAKGIARNAALTALDQGLDLERSALVKSQSGLSTLQHKRGIIANQINTAENLRVAPANIANNLGNITNTGGQQGASGSYFNRDKNTNSILGIFKPESQEAGAKAAANGAGPSLSLSRGGGAIREVLGYELDQRLGLNVVPPTRLAAIESSTFATGEHAKVIDSDNPIQVGSYQTGVSHVAGDLKHYFGDDRVAPRGFDVNSLQGMAILDMISLNADRHGANVMYDMTGRIAAIDQGEIAPHPDRFNQKFKQTGGESGFAWADLPESEQAWSNSNLQTIANLDVNAEIDNLVNLANTQSDHLANITGQPPSKTHLTQDQIDIMRYAGRTLKACAAAGLTPAEIESIYTKRDTGRTATTKRTAKEAGGGEFAIFIAKTYFINAQNMILSQNGGGAPQRDHTYGKKETEDIFRLAVLRGIGRILSKKKLSPSDIKSELSKAQQQLLQP